MISRHIQVSAQQTQLVRVLSQSQSKDDCTLATFICSGVSRLHLGCLTHCQNASHEISDAVPVLLPLACQSLICEHCLTPPLYQLRFILSLMKAAAKVASVTLLLRHT